MLQLHAQEEITPARRSASRGVNIPELAFKRWLTLQEAMVWAGCKSRNTMKKRLREGWYEYDQIENGRGDYLIDRESIDAKHGRTATEALAILKSFRA